MITLEARRRLTTGKGAGRRIRARGYVPAVLYGQGDNLNLVVEPRAVKEILQSPKGINSTFQVQVQGGETVAMARIAEFQKHPLRRTILHCDIQRLDPNEPKVFKVPIKVEGRSLAEKAGGRLLTVTDHTTVRCLPGDVPVAIPVNVEHLEIGDRIRIAELEVPDELELVYRDNYPVVVTAGALIEEVEEGAEDEEGIAAEDEEPEATA